MHARAQKLSIMFPGKENDEAHEAAVKPKAKPKAAASPPASVPAPGPGLASAGGGQGDDDIDGMMVSAAGSKPPPAPAQPKPKPAAPVRATEEGALSKKSAAHAKRVAGLGKPKKRSFYHDSSEDEESDAESGVEHGPQHKAKQQKRTTPAAKPAAAKPAAKPAAAKAKPANEPMEPDNDSDLFLEPAEMAQKYGSSPDWKFSSVDVQQPAMLPQPGPAITPENATGRVFMLPATYPPYASHRAEEGAGFIGWMGTAAWLKCALFAMQRGRLGCSGLPFSWEDAAQLPASLFYIQVLSSHPKTSSSAVSSLMPSSTSAWRFSRPAACCPSMLSFVFVSGWEGLLLARLILGLPPDWYALWQA